MNIQYTLIIIIPLLLPFILKMLFGLSKQQVFDSFFGYYNLWLIWTLSESVNDYVLISLYVLPCTLLFILFREKNKEEHSIRLNYRPLIAFSLVALSVGLLFKMDSLVLLSINFLVCLLTLLILIIVFKQFKQKV